jgi:hypothetical protein
VTRALAAALGVAVLCGFAGASAPATLRVTLSDQMRARPIEGYVWFLGLDGRAKPRPYDTAVVLRATRGTHTLTSYIRTCDGNCGYLDAPSHRCSARVALPGRVALRLVDGGCRVVRR